MELKGDVAIIVGGAGGMGRAIAHILASEGAYVNIVDKDQEGCDKIRKELLALGKDCDVFPIDITSKQEVAKVVQKVFDQHRRIDILVNAAGIVDMGLTEDIEEQDWDRTMAVNVKGPLFFCQAVLPIMKRQRRGKIVSIGSLNGKGIGTSRVDYKTSKAAIHGLTMAIAKEVAAFNINVNAIAPNLVRTPMAASVMTKEKMEEVSRNIPLGRSGLPEDIANAVLFLVSERSSYITGHILDLNGGALMG
jgi:NAD(P)-dependent dehydrogenase (short-subunit alcohol dehydrogenase family)